MNNTFKLTALATAIAALSACSDSDKADALKEYINPNFDVASAVFDTDSYTPINAQDREGTWILSSRFAETFTEKDTDMYRNRNIEPAPTTTTKVKGRVDGGMLSMVTINDIGEGRYNLESVCGEYLDYDLEPVGKNTYEYSSFNKNGSCDDNTTCESYNITFKTNAQATIEYNNSEHEEEGNYFYEEETQATGGLTKISNNDYIQFNTDGLKIKDIDEGAVTNTSYYTAACFFYSAEGESFTETETDSEGNKETSTGTITSNELIIEDDHGRELTYSDEFENEGKDFYNSQDLSTNLDEGITTSFTYYEDSNQMLPKVLAPIAPPTNDTISLDSIRISDGVVTAKGSARVGDSDNGININFTIDTTDTQTMIK